MTNNFSIFLPRIDTRSLPRMSEYEDQNSYEIACIACIQGVFANQGIGTPTRISLLRKYTEDKYLFFVGFVHFEQGLAGTPVATRFRADIEAAQQARVSLPADRYWLVHPYRPRSEPSTHDHQHRLLNPSATPLAPPSMPPPEHTAITPRPAGPRA